VLGYSLNLEALLTTTDQEVWYVIHASLIK
jgi:hypothetical protein